MPCKVLLSAFHATGVKAEMQFKGAGNRIRFSIWQPIIMDLQPHHCLPYMYSERHFFNFHAQFLLLLHIFGNGLLYFNISSVYERISMVATDICSIASFQFLFLFLDQVREAYLLHCYFLFTSASAETVSVHAYTESHTSSQLFVCRIAASDIIIYIYWVVV